MEADVVILADGDFPGAGLAAEILRGAGRVVCCDGAADAFVAEGGVPCAIVGDCDSVSAQTRAGFADRLHPESEQETNDLTKAVRFCLARGLKDITILGATGKREDHTLGNISLLAEYAAMGARVRMVTGHGIFEPVFGETAFDSFPGQQVSIFTLSPQTLISTENLVYPLDNAPLTSWWRGTLNESSASSFTICTDGPTIVFRLLR